MALVDLSDSVDVMTYVEKDDKVRMARFYVYASKLQSLESSGLEQSLQLSKNMPDWKTLMHWGVIVEFESMKDESLAVYTFDADTPDSWIISGGRFVVKIKRYYPAHIRSKEAVGVVDISPKELVERARRVRPNGGRYDFIFSNCQSWAHQFCRDISPDFASCLPLTIGETVGIVAAAGAALTSVGLAGWAVYKAIQHSRSSSHRRCSDDDEEE